MSEHNPIAFAISLLQDKWPNAVKDKDYQFVRWVIEKENMDIFKGFLKLESTPHGSLEETFIVMFTPFEDTHNFAYALASDWMELFQKEIQDGNLPVWTDYDALKQELSLLSPDVNIDGQDVKFLIKLLKSFKQYEGKKTKLVVGIFPYAVVDNKQYIKWLNKTIGLLPSEIAFMTVDIAESKTQNDLFSNEFPKRISILATGLYDSGKIYRQLATAGNPDDPQVVFRTCMFEMGQAAKNGNKNSVYHWGDKALLATQSTGDKLFWASAHIVYAGFLFGFKDTDKIEKLIDNGMQICEQLLEDEDKQLAASGLLAQFYGYKAAYLSILKKHKESIQCFEHQADILIKYNQAVLAIGAFQNALLVAGKHQSRKVQEIAEKGFETGYALEDDLLRTSGFPIVAYYYLRYSTTDPQQRQEIENRMTYLYTEDWQRNAKKHLSIAPEEYITS